MTKVLIGIPVYITNDIHLDFTTKTVQSIFKSDLEGIDLRIILIENYCAPEFKQAILNLGVVRPNPKGNSLPAAWNLAVNEAEKWKDDYVLIINNDILFHPLAIKNLVKFAEEHPEYLIWTSAQHESPLTIDTVTPGDSFDEHPHFSCFLTSPSALERLWDKEVGSKEPFPGRFDENLHMAYFEDGDMHQRLLFYKFKAAHTASSLFYHYGSRTIGVDEELNMLHFEPYEYNRQYLIKKWGIDFHNQVPANDSPDRFKVKGPFEP